MDIKKLLKQNDDLRYNINLVREQIKKMEKIIINNERKIYLKCEHVWEYDNDVGQYDKIRYRCKKCTLWRCDMMYL